MVRYKKRARRLIGPIHQWIEGEIRNDERINILNDAFDYFVEELKKGESVLNAKINTQRKYDVSIEFDTVFSKDPFEQSTLVIKVG